jgi:hypothetical protein
MKRGSLILICFISLKVFSYGIHDAIVFQAYSGSAMLNVDNNIALLWQSGVRYSPKWFPFFILIENNLHSRTRTYDWPEVGKYKYRRTINNINFDVGGHILRKKNLSFLAGFGFAYSEAKGKLITNNSTIKSYLKESYVSVLPGSASIYLQTNYRISHHISCYLNFRTIKSQNKGFNPIIGIGLGYNVSKGKKHRDDF